MAEEKRETRWERLKANVKTIGGAVLLAVVIRIVLFEAFEIEGPSMEPTLLHGDRVVVAKFFYGLFLPFTSHSALTWGTPEAGEVVIVKSPADEIDIVKRVVGVPGDTIAIRDDAIWRNGEPIPTEELGPCEHERSGEYRRPGAKCVRVRETLAGITYLTSRSPATPPANHPKVRVPEGHVYILGDHRDRSNDSRNPLIGPVEVDRVKGEALFVYWSDSGHAPWYSFSDVRWERIGAGAS